MKFGALYFSKILGTLIIIYKSLKKKIFVNIFRRGCNVGVEVNDPTYTLLRFWKTPVKWILDTVHSNKRKITVLFFEKNSKVYQIVL